MRSLTHAISSCATAVAAAEPAALAEGRVGAVALRELPQMVRSLGAGHGRSSVHFLGALRSLGEACPAALVSPWAHCVGVLACIEGGHAIVGSEDSSGARCIRCATCDADGAGGGAGSTGSAGGAGADGAVAGGGAADGAADDDGGGAAAAGLFNLLPLLWSRFEELPPAEGRARGALVRGISRLARHAHALDLARQPDLLVPLIQYLSDEDADVRAACEASLPRLLAHAPFVRSILDPPLPERAPLSPSALIDSMLHPLADAIRSEADAAERKPIQLTMLRTLGALGIEPLYASDDCLAAIVLVLSEHLGVGDAPSAEHSLALQLLEAIACAQPASAHPDAPPLTISSLCRRLAPHLAPDWSWWLTTRPLLFSAVARSLCDTDEGTLLRLLAPRAVPRLVLVGALASPGSWTPGAAELLRQLRVLHADADDADGQGTYAIASTTLGSLASALGTTPKALLVEHMHLILAEIFTRAAAADGGELANAAIPGALEFFYAHGIPRAETLPSMISMGARELFQEMVNAFAAAPRYTRASLQPYLATATVRSRRPQAAVDSRGLRSC